MSFETAAILFAWIAIALLGLALAGLVRQFHQWVEGQRPEPLTIGPAIGSMIMAPTPEGSIGGQRTLMLFVNTTCSGCERVLPELPELAAVHGSVRILALFPGDADGYGTLEGIEVVENQAPLFSREGISITPFGVALSETGAVMDSSPVGSGPRLSLFMQRNFGSQEE